MVADYGGLARVRASSILEQFCGKRRGPTSRQRGARTHTRTHTRPQPDDTDGRGRRVEVLGLEQTGPLVIIAVVIETDGRLSPLSIRPTASVVAR